MNITIPPETIEIITQNLSIVEVTSGYIDLQKRGNSLSGSCPICKTKNGFTVSPNKNIFKCFACGIGGNPIKFIMQMEELNYKEAIEFIMNKYDKKLKLRLSNKQKQIIFCSIFFLKV